MNYILIAVVVLVVLGGAYYYWDSNIRSTDSADTSSISSMRAEGNAVVATDQKPSDQLSVAQVYLEEDGYVVIHEDSDGAAGAILGASALLSAGETNDVNIKLSRTTRDGEVLHAMLHNEMGGNAEFSAAEDTPVQSILGGPLMGSFNISSDVSGSVPVSI